MATPPIRRWGMGTYGSRSLAVGGSAMVRATEKIINKVRKIAAHLMEAWEGDIELKDGHFTVAGTDKSVAWDDVTLAAYVPHNHPLEEIEPGLEETAFYDPANFTFPAGAYAAEVEVDPETGRVTIERFSAADDFGNVVNPMIVDGQMHGGIAQGIGQAFLEGCAYDETGQLLTGSYMDYAALLHGKVWNCAGFPFPDGSDSRCGWPRTPAPLPPPRPSHVIASPTGVSTIAR